MQLSVAEPRIFRALAAVPIASLLPSPGGRGARAAGLAAGLLRVRTQDAPFVVLLRRGFVIVAADPLREVRMARALSPAGLLLGAGVAVAPAGPGSTVTASFHLTPTGLCARVIAAAAWPVIKRPVSVSLDRWLSAVAAETTR